MKIYFATITDYTGQDILSLEYTASAKHSAKLAQLYLDSCPPAAGFKIRMNFINPSAVASLLNNRN
jgi:hypothetical protein